tara:strand:- start:527 stop:679 length:153 start_codon:yes stop_codon:yes gene_type:complete
MEDLNKLYDSIKTLINNFEDESNNIIVIEYDIKELKKAYNNLCDNEEDKI